MPSRKHGSEAGLGDWGSGSEMSNVQCPRGNSGPELDPNPTEHTTYCLRFYNPGKRVSLTIELSKVDFREKSE